MQLKYNLTEIYSIYVFKVCDLGNPLYFNKYGALCQMSVISKVFFSFS